MGKLRFVALCLAVAACGSDKATPVDAAIDAPKSPDAKLWMDAPPGPTFDFTCIGNAAPMMADATITLSGTATEVSGTFQAPAIAAANDAMVDVCTGDCVGQNKLDTKMTDTDGKFATAAVSTGGSPLEAYLKIARTTDYTTLLYPPGPLTSDPPALPVFVFEAGFFGQFQSATKGLMVIAVVDCANMPISDSSNIQVSIKQGGQEVQGTFVVDASMFDPALAGSFIVPNVPPAATTTVGATYKNKTLRAHDVTVAAATVTETIVRPGY